MALLGREQATTRQRTLIGASEKPAQLQSELGDIENKVSATRRFFNNAVSEYNSAIEMFPATLIAGWLGFRSSEFFDVGEEQRQVLDAAPKVQFG